MKSHVVSTNSLKLYSDVEIFRNKHFKMMVGTYVGWTVYVGFAFHI